MQAKLPGKLIVFEGGEGSGKTTQLQRIHAWLRDWLNTDEALKLLGVKDTANAHHPGVKLTREPGGTDIGKQIRHLLLNDHSPVPIISRAELLLYAADRAQHVEETLLPWLKQGDWVLCDRYTDSTVAYQGYGRQLDLPLIHQLNQIATGGLKSDLTLWLNVSPAIGLARMHQRGQADRIEQASSAFHQRVYDGFAALAQPTPEGEPPPFSSGPTVVIDGDRPVETITAQIQEIILNKFT